MAASTIIVMYAGVTPWVGWELSTVVTSGFAGKLILIFFSPIVPKGGKRRKAELAEAFKNDMATRLAGVRAVLAGTRWQAAWEKVSSPETLVAAHFDDAGGITVLRSKRRSNDAFQIGVEIAHLMALGHLPPPVPS